VNNHFSSLPSSVRRVNSWLATTSQMQQRVAVNVWRKNTRTAVLAHGWRQKWIISFLISDELVPRNYCHTWEIIARFCYSDGSIVETLLSSEDTAHLPLLLSCLYSSLISTVCEGWPICKCLHSEIQLSSQGRQLLLGPDWENKGNRITTNAPF